ncbi:MAG: hypothetical protein K6G48_01315 [Acholeplasmatales bacterium]|nr:hypothetical protein [Acholeplasmatales bacterium]
MANKNEVQEKKENKGKVYHNPLQTVWGKILIWTLSLAMVLGILIALIWNIVENFGQV